MRTEQMDTIADWMDEIIRAPESETVATRVRGEIKELCAHFAAPGIRVTD